MTTRSTWGRMFRLTGFLLLLAATRVASAEAAEIVRQHVCDGACAACQQATDVVDLHASPAGQECVRAGNPHRIAWYAQPTRTARDTFGYVGGGTAWRGEPREADEGTWGRDFAGLFSKNHLWLKWLHGRPTHQTGGSYNTDGPHFLPH